MGNKLTYATVCSGIECMSAACPDLPLEPVFFSEIEPFPCAVLKSHFPNVPNFGDMSNIKVSTDGKEITNGSTRIILGRRLDIFAGGTPCQDVSVAGKRSGMQEGSGTRSSLAFEFIRLTRELKPKFVIWENVAGVLSDKSFPEFLTALANCGYGVAYRTLDAQYVRCADIHHKDGRVYPMERAIPQRRRRVWVVGCLGEDVSKTAQILFECQGLGGNTPPRRKTRKEIAAASRERNQVHGRVVEDCSNTLNAIEQHKVAYDMQAIAEYGHGEVSSTVKRRDSKDATDLVVHFYENHAQDSRVREITVSPTIPQKAGTGGNNLPLTVFSKVSHACGKDGQGEKWDCGEVAGTRNVFDVSETRSQECVVHITNSNGGDVMPTLDCNGQSASGPGAQEDKRGGYVITRIEKDVDIAMSYDGYNQAGKEECCHTLGTCNSESPNNDKVVKVAIKQSFGINPQGGQMLPFDKELGETFATGHQGGVMVEQDIAQTKYIVRRLTPTECERLMGLPDGWTIPKNLEVTDELVEEFRIIHDNFKRIMAEYENEPTPKPTSANQVRKWLENITNPDTCPDAP